MTTFQELRQTIKKMEDKAETAARKKQEFATIEEETKIYLDLLRQIEPLVKKGIEDPIEQAGPSLQTIRKRPGKTNVQVYEEIMSLHGRPMHLTDILESAARMGVSFKTTGDTKAQLRNALNGAKKRFENMGNNTWWIRGKSVPGEENRDDRPLNPSQPMSEITPRTGNHPRLHQPKPPTVPA